MIFLEIFAASPTEDLHNVYLTNGKDIRILIKTDIHKECLVFKDNLTKEFQETFVKLRRPIEDIILEEKIKLLEDIKYKDFPYKNRPDICSRGRRPIHELREYISILLNKLK
jgi:hypothetical protein